MTKEYRPLGVSKVENFPPSPSQSQFSQKNPCPHPIPIGKFFPILIPRPIPIMLNFWKFFPSPSNPHKIFPSPHPHGVVPQTHFVLPTVEHINIDWLAQITFAWHWESNLWIDKHFHNLSTFGGLHTTSTSYLRHEQHLFENIVQFQDETRPEVHLNHPIKCEKG